MKKVVNGKNVIANVDIRASRDDKVSTPCVWTLDFSTCTDEQLTELASRSIIITLQNRWRKSDAKTRKEMAELNVDVAEELARERTVGKPSPERVKKMALDLDEKTRAELLAALMAEQKK